MDLGCVIKCVSLKAGFSFAPKQWFMRLIYDLGAVTPGCTRGTYTW